MREMPIWLDYAEFDDDGLCGISPNAPDEVKKAYEDYLAEEEEAKSKGIKIIFTAPLRRGGHAPRERVS